MRNSSVIGRVAAVAAVVVAIVAVAVILLSGGTTYTLRANFQNASQIVQGDLVEVAGNPVGTVSKIAITPDGLAQISLGINNAAYQHIPQGTQATVREASLSGIANRYVNLTLGPSSNPSIPNNGMINANNTTSEVDLDQIFNTLDGPTRRGLQNVFLGSARQLQGAGAKAQAALAYLNPAIASSSTLFNEIDRNTGQFTNFVVKTGNLVTDLASRSSDLSGLVSHLSTTTAALASRRAALGSSLRQLPGFMRLANTTFVNLRAALNDLTPLVNVSKPVAPKLQKLLVQLRPLAIDSVPTVRDLSNIIHRPGASNDLIELTRLGVPLAASTVRPIVANGKKRTATFPESIAALNASTPEFATARPYAVDLTGWFEGFTHPGQDDANGGTSRVAPNVGLGSISNGALNIFENGGLLFNQADFALRKVLAFGGNGQCGSAHLRPGRPLPGLDGARRGLVPGERLPVYPESGSDGQMKRIAISAVLLAMAAAFIIVATGASNGSAIGTYKIELDNAFGLVTGAQFKVAGVEAGAIKAIDLDHKSLHAVVTVSVTRPGFGSFHQSATCQSRPQSLIGEYFIDCNPGTSGPVIKPGRDDPGHPHAVDDRRRPGPERDAAALPPAFLADHQ